MTDTETKAAGRKPTHRLYQVIGEGDQANWTLVGAAWPNKDGQGFNLNLDALPTKGRLVMRVITEKDEVQAEGDQR